MLVCFLNNKPIFQNLYVYMNNILVTFSIKDYNYIIFYKSVFFYKDKLERAEHSQDQ